MSMYKIEFTQVAIKTTSKYKKSNPIQYKKRKNKVLHI
mgnify:CR=1 FL=1